MTIEITAPPDPGSDTARRYGYIAALSAAEHVLSTTPVIPTDVTIQCAPWDGGPLLRIHFHNAPDAVRAFSEAFGGTVTEEEGRDGETRHTTAVGVVAGLPFEAWAVTRIGGAE
ncbi:MAG: hypothetical protein HOV66_27920 [Streptomycetaceae bacterium]|nr:hypothetical protein [Streptomycetaceae bacterium]